MLGPPPVPASSARGAAVGVGDQLGGGSGGHGRPGLDFEQMVLTEIDERLAAGRPFNQAAHEVAVGAQNVVLGVIPDKAVAGSAAFAVARVARTHPAAPGAAAAEGTAPAVP